VVLLVPNHKPINLLPFFILGTLLADTFSAQFFVAEEILKFTAGAPGRFAACAAARSDGVVGI
jgi:hypothetical protein